MATLSTARGAPEQQRLYTSAAVALIVELALLAGVWSLLRHNSAEPPPESPPTLLSLTDAPAPQPAPAAPPVPKPQAPHPVVQPPRPRVATPVHRAAHVAPPRPVAQPPRSAPAPTPTVAPTDPAPPPTPAPAAPVAPPAPAHPSSSFESALRAAIQAALRYPESARMGGISGRTRVQFQYRDGVVSGATVVVSSGVALLDRAALAAVRDANYPKPDAGFAGKTLTEQLWVNFNLDNQE